jgi:hypothetical protein
MIVKDGVVKPDRKYLGAPGSGNRLYIPPGITPEQLADVKIPIAIVEGEKKALALWRLANHETNQPGSSHCARWRVNWRGTVGKIGGPNGERLDLKGPIADHPHRVGWPHCLGRLRCERPYKRQRQIGAEGIVGELATRARK